MRTASLAVCSVVVAAAVYVVALAVALLALILGLFAIMAASGGRHVPYPGQGAELLLLFLPALATGAVVVRVRPFFSPLISGAVGAAAALGAACVLIAGASHLIEKPPQWQLIVYPATGGLLAVIGCIVGRKVRPSTPSSMTPQSQL
ncbi:MAG: hypothetical protein ACJ8C4_15310 [Gemmataceae bacterium]